MTTQATQLSAYQKSVFTAETREGKSISHDVYARGSGGPVVLIQELYQALDKKHFYLPIS